MRRILAITAAIILPSLALTPAFAQSNVVHRTIDQTFVVTGASHIAFEVPSGNLNLTPEDSRRQASRTGAGAQAATQIVRIHGEITGRENEADAVHLTGALHGTEYRIAVIEPNTMHGPFSSNYDVTFPANTAIRVDDSAGNVRVTDATHDIALYSEAGNISAAISPDWSGKTIDLSSEAGNVKLETPPNFHASLRASTTAGTVRNEAGLPATGSGTAVTLTTEAGNITIR